MARARGDPRDQRRLLGAVRRQPRDLDDRVEGAVELVPLPDRAEVQEALCLAAFAALSLLNSAEASTPGQRNALESAKSYLSSGAFSKSGLVKQLKYEKFSTSDARWAVNHVRVSWNAEAVESAESYLDSGSFSCQALIDQLEYEGFTHAQAKYGVKKAYS